MTLDDDVAAKLKAEARRSGQRFKEAVNGFLRLGLAFRPEPKDTAPFKVKVRPLQLRPGFDLDNIEELIEKIEGPFHR